MKAWTRARSLAWIVVVYSAALVVALWLGARLSHDHPWWLAVAVADGAATVVVFAFSVVFDNSSVYDPYWSVAPVVIAIATIGPEAGASLARRVAVVALVSLWGARLTSNGARGWQGMRHEDWRYADLRRVGPFYWVVSFLGFHVMPTIWVYLGCLPLRAALSTGVRPMSWWSPWARSRSRRSRTSSCALSGWRTRLRDASSIPEPGLCAGTRTTWERWASGGASTSSASPPTPRERGRSWAPARSLCCSSS